MAVHHVDVYVIGAGGCRLRDLLSQAREVGGKNGWGNLDHRVLLALIVHGYGRKRKEKRMRVA